MANDQNNPTAKDRAAAIERDRNYWRKEHALVVAAADEALVRLSNDLAEWRSFGIVDVAARNPKVAEYCDHWEARAAKAEKTVRQLLEAMRPFAVHKGEFSGSVPVQSVSLSEWNALVDAWEKGGGRDLL